MAIPIQPRPRKQAKPAVNVTVEMVSSAAKILIGPALSAQINDMESQLKSAGNDAPGLSCKRNLPNNGTM